MSFDIEITIKLPIFSFNQSAFIVITWLAPNSLGWYDTAGSVTQSTILFHETGASLLSINHFLLTFLENILLKVDWTIYGTPFMVLSVGISHCDFACFIASNSNKSPILYSPHSTCWSFSLSEAVIFPGLQCCYFWGDYWPPMRGSQRQFSESLRVSAWYLSERIGSSRLHSLDR